MNINEVRKTLEVFYPDGGLIEVRSVRPLSGYFKDHNNLLSCVSQYPNETFYFVLNEISDGCYGKEQNEKIMANGKKKLSTTADNDIIKRKWILVDADPKRTADTSSTDEEKQSSKIVIGKIYNYLKNIGFQEPIVADSGNGYHLLYKVHLDNTDNETQLIKNFLLALDMMFTDDRVGIDTSVFNASRITKLYGVVAGKGASIKERPHRLSRILRVPDIITPTSIKLIEKVAAIVPVAPPPTYRNNYNGAPFDIEAFIAKHGIRISRKGTWTNGTKYVLEECVFDPSHKSPDAAICVGNGGAIGYHCFHNSCQGRRWQDVRLMFEPNAYDREREYQQTRTTKPQTVTREQLLQSKPIDKTGEEAYPFKRMMDITPLDRSKLVVAKSGFTELDKAIIGHNKGELSIWSGGTGSGKSTILSQLALNNIHQGFKVALFSGELRNSRVKDWFMLQAAGRQYVKPSEYHKGYYVPRDIVKQIEEWSADKIWVYDNDKGVSVDNVLDNFKRHIEKYQTDIVIIDNMMSLDMARVHGDKYERQTALVLALSDMVKRYNVHVHFVCHPRKPTGFFRKADISGTADITNAADNVFMMHRVNNDFKRFAKDFLTDGVAREYYEYTNVMEVMKNRDLGVEDLLIGFLYEPESRRMLNERQENIVYGWNTKPYYESPEDGFTEIPIADDDLPEQWRKK